LADDVGIQFVESHPPENPDQALCEARSHTVPWGGALASVRLEYVSGTSPG
jgi:hypothetical protein